MKKPNIDKAAVKFFILDIFYGGREYKTTQEPEHQKTPFPLKTVALTVCVTVLILSMIFPLIKISDISAEIASLRRQSIDLAVKKDSLANELDHRYSFAEIIETAKELGYAENVGKVVYIETTQAEETSEQPDDTTETQEDENIGQEEES
jgi:hypothetical protein